MMAPETLYCLVLLAALAHAGWNALLKTAADPLLMLTAIRAVGLVFGLSLLSFVPVPALEVWPWLLLNAAAQYCYYALLIHSYRHGDMSHVYPLARGAAPILLVFFAYVIADEHLTLLQIAAVGLSSSGVMLLALGRGRNLQATAFALATAFAIASYSLLGGIGVRLNGSVWGFQAYTEILTSIGLLVFAGWRRGRAVESFVRTQWSKGIFAGVISAGSYLAYLTAVTVLPLAPVAALRESSALFGTLLGVFVLKERFGIYRLLAAGLITAGIVLLGLLAFRY